MFRIRHGTLINLFGTECLTSVFTTRRYTNPRLPYLTLFNGRNFWPTLYITITTTTTVIICPTAIAYSMGQIIKSVCVCVCVCVSVRLRALSRSDFLIDFHQNWHRRKNPKK